MSYIEKKIIDLLEDLKENYGIIGVKSEFEAEGATFQEALKLKEISSKLNLKFAIKIGGAEALKDMYEARKINSDFIIAPMIETSYAMKKYVNALKKVYNEKEKNIYKFLFNIETMTGYLNLDSMINSCEFSYIDGITIGRSDLAGSLEINSKNIESEKIFNLVENISKKIQKTKKNLAIGGAISTQTIPFLKKMPYLSHFETRKIIFSANVLNNKNIDVKRGILKAINFEILWIENKLELFGKIYKADKKRLMILKERCKI